eukprot:Nitzschia sp. Nitz4//scaffold95_size97785//6851//13079//NITZ4_004655-RA/size97785-processed-gene-0.3-mRNA-1//1//CDS//3329560436//8732//frame0
MPPIFGGGNKGYQVMDSEHSSTDDQESQKTPADPVAEVHPESDDEDVYVEDELEVIQEVSTVATDDENVVDAHVEAASPEPDVESPSDLSRDPEETGRQSYAEETKEPEDPQYATTESRNVATKEATKAPEPPRSANLPPLDEAAEDRWLSSKSGLATVGCLVTLVLLGVAFGLGWGATRPWINKDNDKEPSSTTAPTMAPTISMAPTTTPMPTGISDEELMALFASVVGDVVYEEGTPYNNAAVWFIQDDPARLKYQRRRLQEGYSDKELLYIQRFLMGYLWFVTTDNGANEWLSCNPVLPDYEEEDCTYQKPIRKSWDGTLVYQEVPWTRWLSGAAECSWAGVTCVTTGSGRLAVSGIDLGGQGLNASTLSIIEMMHLPELETLELAYNQITGTLQTNFSTLDLLDLTDNQLTGTLILLGGLSSLTLEGNQFTGTLPIELFEFTTPLKHLNLGGNQLTGTIPPEASYALSLTSLYIHENLLTGTIPPELGQLPLKALRVYGNDFIGSIPMNSVNDEWLDSLEELWLYDNGLTGSIPEVMGSASRLMDVRLSGNSLTGLIPDSLYDLDQLFRFEVANNALTGYLSSSISSDWTNLEVLDLSGNQFEGRILLDGQLSNLQSVDVSLNQFSGSVPTSLCRLTTLEALVADCLPPANPSNACICCTSCCSRDTMTCSSSGVSPVEAPSSSPASSPTTGATLEEIQEWAQVVFGSDIDLSSGAPHSLTSIWISQLDSMELSTSDASLLQRYTLALFYFMTRQWKSCNAASTNSCLYYELVVGEDGSLSYDTSVATRWLSPLDECDWVGVSCTSGSVSGLALPGQEISSTLPTELLVLPDLVTLDLGYNEFFGTIPDDYTVSTSLVTLQLQGNALTGTVPSAFASATNTLASVSLDSNSFSGGLFASLSSVGSARSSLRHLSVGGNGLTGTIPTILGSLTRLTSLDLQGNAFTSMPTELFRLVRLTKLQLDENSLVGSIPTEVGQLRQLTLLSMSENSLSGSLPLEVYVLSNLLRLDAELAIMSENDDTYQYDDSYLSCDAQLTLTLEYNPDPFVVNTATQNLHSSTPRFGHSTDINQLIVGSDSEQKDYLTGLLGLSALLFILFVTWTSLLFMLKCVGPARVGFLSGRKVAPARPVKPAAVKKQERLRRAHPFQHNGVAGDGGGNKPAKSILKPVKGVAKVVKPVATAPITVVKKARRKKKELNHRSKFNKMSSDGSFHESDMEDSSDGELESPGEPQSPGSPTSHSEQQPADVITFEDRKAIVQYEKDWKEYEKVVFMSRYELIDSIDTFKGGLSESKQVINLALEAIQSYTDNQAVAEAWTSEFISTVNELDDVESDLIQMEEKIDQASLYYPKHATWAFWASAGSSLMLGTMGLIFTACMIYLDMNGELPPHFRWVRSWVMVPATIVLVAVSWILAMVYVLVGMGSADMCFNSPDTPVLNLLTLIESEFNSFVYRFTRYVVAGCPVIQAPETIQNAVEFLRDLVIPALGNLAEAILEVGEENQEIACGTGVASVLQLIGALGAQICVVVYTIADLSELLQCEQWYPMYEQTMHDAICTSATEAFTWAAATQCTIVLLSLVFLSLRIGFYEEAEVVVLDGDTGNIKGTKNNTVSNNNTVETQS